jgi:Raf kinase inhibitor-like YbhB/YbcL family protein
MTLHLTSPAFSDQNPIPKIFSRDGRDISPQLEWSDAPPQTQAFAMICDDPDAPRKEPWVHWLIYNIPRSIHQLPENIPKAERVDTLDGALQGKNSWDSVGYGGPQPPPGHGTHHYHFKLYALDQELPLKPGASKQELLSAMSNHILDEVELVGTYER